MGKNAKVAGKTKAPEVAGVQLLQKKDKEKEGNLYGNLIICYLWKHQVDTVINVRITDTNAKSYISRPLESVLAAQEKEKGKYLNSCLEQN
eukprot:11264145-Ditylum_brightwellii.AAC.2